MSAPDHDPATAPAECPGPRRLTATEARALVEERQGGPLTAAQAATLDALWGWDGPAPLPVDPAPDLAAVIASAPGVSSAMVASDRRWLVLRYAGREVQVRIHDMGPWREA